jgi:hypothetical protein
MAAHPKICAECGASFYAQINAQYCAMACRVRAFRRRKREARKTTSQEAS